MSAPNLNIDELERLALAATPGPWVSDRGWVESDSGVGVVEGYDSVPCEEADADFIAAANPATILALIAIVREKFASAIVEMFHHPDAEADEIETTMFLVGKYADGAAWEFQGVFVSKDLAVSACRTEQYFVAPVILNQQLPDDTREWPGCYYPNTKLTGRPSAA